jgi:hypothetical protein
MASAARPRPTPRDGSVSAVSLDQPQGRFVCDACGNLTEGEPAGQGSYLVYRAGELRFEDAPLCELCAMAINVAALTDQEIEEEG